MDGAVLLADADESARSHLEAALLSHGYVVRSVGTGSDAIAGAHGVDTVLLDLELPDMASLDVLDAIRALPHPPPVIVITRSVDRDAPACLSRGAHDFLSKPPRIEELVERVAAAVRVKRLQDELDGIYRALEREATTDPLTDLANRRHGEATLHRLVAAAQSHDCSLCVLMVDLDHFKKINDTYGHEAGDRCLREAARRLSDSVRHSDLAIRWGGEEFVVLMPDVAEQVAGNVAELIRTAIHTVEIGVGEASVQVTASIGWSTLQVDDDTHSVVDRADRAVYQAKRQGRNRVVGPTDLIPPDVLQAEEAQSDRRSGFDRRRANSG